MEKVDLFLEQLLNERARALADARARGDEKAAARAEDTIDVYVAFDGDVGFLAAKGLPLFSRVTGIARGAITPAQIRAAVALPEVHMVRLPDVPELALNFSVRDINARDKAWVVGVGATDPAKGKGKGVIVGIVDSGIDVFHGSFLKPDGTTRILKLWDQTFRFDPADGALLDGNNNRIPDEFLPRDEQGKVLTRERAPTLPPVIDQNTGQPVIPQKYGAEFSTEQINIALKAHPDGDDLPISLCDQPVSGDLNHGTHVAGIAAGNGVPGGCEKPGTFIGVAPEAHLVIVKTGVGGDRPGISNLADAATYIFEVAKMAQCPAVVNISLASHQGPHNGHSVYARVFDMLTSGADGIGRAIVIAAGNDRDKDRHAAFTIAQGERKPKTVSLDLTEKENEVSLFGSYNPAAKLTCVVRLPVSGKVLQTQPLAVDRENARVPLGTHTVQVARRRSLEGDPDSHFIVAITPPKGEKVRTDEWQFDLATTSADAHVHLWIGLPAAGRAKFLPSNDDTPSPQDVKDNREVKRPAEWIAATISSHASCRSAITVAAYDSTVPFTPLAPFSSQGPAPHDLRLGLSAGAFAKPDIAAPGVKITAPRAAVRKCCLVCECWVRRYVAELGTSCAAPHITGVVALMFAQNPLLTSAEIKERLQKSVRPSPSLPVGPGFPKVEHLFGSGLVNAEKAALAARRELTAPVATETPPIVVAEPAVVSAGWPDRLRAWNAVLGPRPAWNVCAALVSLHFDEVKRLIDTNRRVGAVWQRHGGPALVRQLVFADTLPDPPIPAEMATTASRELLAHLLKLFMRFGGEALRADVVRYGSFAQSMPGATWDELDALVQNGRIP